VKSTDGNAPSSSSSDARKSERPKIRERDGDRQRSHHAPTAGAVLESIDERLQARRRGVVLASGGAHVHWAGRRWCGTQRFGHRTRIAFDAERPGCTSTLNRGE
jgi:hypothetical protein